MIKIFQKPRNCQEAVDHIIQYGACYLTHPHERIDNAIKEYGVSKVLEALAAWRYNQKARHLETYIRENKGR